VEVGSQDQGAGYGRFFWGSAIGFNLEWPDTVLEVHTGVSKGTGWAVLTRKWPNNLEPEERIEFTWTAPPARICSAEQLNLNVEARIVNGKPREDKSFVLQSLKYARSLAIQSGCIPTDEIDGFIKSYPL